MSNNRYYRLYEISQQYGGPEEGGWYFQRFRAVGEVYNAPAEAVASNVVEIDASHPLKLPSHADNRPEWWDGDTPLMPWDDEAPTPRLYSWLVEFTRLTPVYDEESSRDRLAGYDCTTSQRVVTALSHEDLIEDLGAGYDPETDECPKVICMLPDDVAAAYHMMPKLLAASKTVLEAFESVAVGDSGDAEQDAAEREAFDELKAAVAEAEGK